MRKQETYERIYVRWKQQQQRTVSLDRDAVSSRYESRLYAYFIEREREREKTREGEGGREREGDED